MISVKVTTVGNSAGIVLPKEALAHLGVQKGDKLLLSKTEEGYALIHEGDIDDNHLKIIDDLMSRYSYTMKKLAE